jgi:predicted nucleic-acid-binding protein
VIGLDTNFVVRYLAQDDPVQSAKATQVFECRLTEEEPGFVSLVTIVETVWVLDKAYGVRLKRLPRLSNECYKRTLSWFRTSRRCLPQ